MWNRSSALFQTGFFSQLSNFSRYGSKSLQNDSDASLGKSVGKWSIATTSIDPPSLTSTTTVGSSNVVQEL